MGDFGSLQINKNLIIRIQSIKIKNHGNKSSGFKIKGW
jgi:hypothetical protein